MSSILVKLYEGGRKYFSSWKGDEKEEINVYKSESNIASSKKPLLTIHPTIKLDKHQVSEFWANRNIFPYNSQPHSTVYCYKNVVANKNINGFNK